MSKIKLDVAGSLDEITAMATRHGLDHQVVALVGPAGGNPLVEFTGAYEAIEAMVRQEYARDEEEATYILEDMVAE